MINCTSRSGGGYIKQRHSSQEGMYYDTFMVGARKSTRLLWASRGSGGEELCLPDGYAYQTTSGHGAKHVQSSHVSPEEGCYNMSGSFRTDYHIDFTGSTTGTADSSSGSVQLIIWRTRRHHAEDNATTRAMSGGRMPRNTRSLLMTNEREFWRRAWTRAGWTTVHLHPGRRAGGMSAGTGTTERTRISYP